MSWMTKYRVYCQQLGHDEDWLRFIRSHAEPLLPIASRHTPTCTLLEESQETATGRRLGRKEFERVVADIEARITASRKGIDELRWTTEDTRRIVAEILGNPDVKVNKKYHCAWVGSDKVKIEAIDAVIDSPEELYIYNLKADIIPLEHFVKIVGNGVVEGLGEEWRG